MSTLTTTSKKAKPMATTYLDLKAQIKALEEQAEELRKNELTSVIEDMKLKISEYEKELELKKKQEDAKENWKSKIDETFVDLTKYLVPIRIEQFRLKILFYVFLSISILLVLAIVIIEIFVIKKLFLHIFINESKFFFFIV